MKAVLFAVAMTLAAVPTWADSSVPDPRSLALAQRYMKATGGTYELIAQQSYVAAGIMGDTPTSHARQQALLQAADLHRAELDALDGQLETVLAQLFTADELTVAVDFLESSQGRSITEKKHAYFTALFARDRPALAFTPEENAALAAFNGTPEAASMKVKSPTLLAQTVALATPVQSAIRKSAQRIYCRETHKCTDDSGYDQLSGPSIRE